MDKCKVYVGGSSSDGSRDQIVNFGRDLKEAGFEIVSEWVKTIEAVAATGEERPANPPGATREER